MEKLSILKIGGNIINKADLLKIVLNNFSNRTEKKILVHGGGRKASELMRQMNLEPQMIDGRRVTDAPTLEIVTMVYAGLLNKKIVAQLQYFGTNALGLAGADLNSIQAHKRPVKTIDYGFVGDIDKVSGDSIELLLQHNITPVFCAITHDQKGQLLNTNADTIAATIASALAKSYDVDLLYCFGKKGVLKDPNDDESIIPFMNYESFKTYQQKGIISNGMIPKLDNAFDALGKGVSRVLIGSPAIAESNFQETCTILNL